MSPPGSIRPVPVVEMEWNCGSCGDLWELKLDAMQEYTDKNATGQHNRRTMTAMISKEMLAKKKIEPGCCKFGSSLGPG